MIQNPEGTSTILSNPRDSIVPPTEKGVVLLVEDHEIVRTVVQAFLKKEGYRVLEAVDGEAGLEIFRRNANKINLVITDVLMPGIDGNELANRILVQDSGMKIIFISGYSKSLVSGEVLANPNIRFMRKPFSFMDLRRSMEELLPIGLVGGGKAVGTAESC